MERPQKVSIFAATAAAAALSLLPSLEGAPQKPAVKTGDKIELPAASRPADFDQTIYGEAPLKSEAESEQCFTTAVQALATQRGALQKQCLEGDGNFNTGTLTAGLYRGGCRVSQMVTCTGTAATKAQEEAAERAELHKGEKAPNPAAAKGRKAAYGAPTGASPKPAPSASTR
jgi:hypothetical protein